MRFPCYVVLRSRCFCGGTRQKKILQEIQCDVSAPQQPVGKVGNLKNMEKQDLAGGKMMVDG
jgi:hypothetical protein